MSGANRKHIRFRIEAAGEGTLIPTFSREAQMGMYEC